MNNVLGRLLKTKNSDKLVVRRHVLINSADTGTDGAYNLQQQRLNCYSLLIVITIHWTYLIIADSRDMINLTIG